MCHSCHIGHMGCLVFLLCTGGEVTSALHSKPTAPPCTPLFQETPVYGGVFQDYLAVFKLEQALNPCGLSLCVSSIHYWFGRSGHKSCTVLLTMGFLVSDEFFFFFRYFLLCKKVRFSLHMSRSNLLVP